MDWNSLFFLIGNVAGVFLKKAPWFNTKFVPGAIFVVMAIGRLIAGIGIEVPVSTVDGDAVHYAGFAWGAILQAALWDTMKAVFAHTVTKNGIQGLKKEPSKLPT